MRLALPIFRKLFKRYDALNESVQENISGIRVVKSFVRKDYEIEKLNKVSNYIRTLFTKAENVLAFNNPAMMLSINGSNLLL
jgi:ATP-binding cassette subfamily B protein